MTLVDIENLSAADLKSRATELAASAAKAKPADLAERFVAARADAKLRDEKLAEQGATLTALRQGLAAATERADGLAAKLAEAERKAATQDKLLRESADAIGGLREALAAAAKRADEATARAQARRAVLAQLSGLIAPLLAAE